MDVDGDGDGDARPTALWIETARRLLPGPEVLREEPSVPVGADYPPVESPTLPAGRRRSCGAVMNAGAPRRV